ncbi:alpha/beta hydrolase [Aliarcobacter butzleri]|uniref:alpha/beta hydrolase n=1 Tax=Aliarcobacter butzleri TaxID=28197 RepID=UPI003B20E793
MKFLLLIISSLLFISCSKNIPSIEERKSSAMLLASKNHLEENILKSTNFNIFSLQSDFKACKNGTLNIYIEGDGLAWISKTQVSSNPTPINRTLLNLLTLDDSSCRVYLARPCQYINSYKCQEEYWTNKRFSKEIIDSFNEVLNSLKDKFLNKDFNIIGYSGGGAVATLLASKRDDIKYLITIAGNLDIEKWTKIHNISKLDGSLNPADFTANIENIKQYHIVGNSDKIVPKEIFLSYFSKFKNKENIEYIYTDSTHICCFENSLKEVLNKIKD